MFLLHCTKCQAEWQGAKESKCYDCGSEGYILEELESLNIIDFIKSLGEEDENIVY